MVKREIASATHPLMDLVLFIQRTFRLRASKAISTDIQKKMSKPNRKIQLTIGGNHFMIKT